MPTAEQISEHFDGWELGEGEREYLRYHSRRFELLLDKVDEALAGWRAGGEQPPLRVLDVGAGFQTELIRSRHPDVEVDTLGFGHPRFGERNIWFDLNDSVDRDRWPDASDYHVLVLAEVIEHVHTSPQAVLACLGSMLRPGGSLIVQTPNAVALHKRLAMLAGRHPYPPLNDNRHDPMHFRESTRPELEAAGREAGLELVESSLHNYFARGSALGRAYVALGGVLPPGLRAGITAVFRRPAEAV